VVAVPSEDYHKAIMSTWGRRCVRLLFIVGSNKHQMTNMSDDGRAQLIHLVGWPCLRAHTTHPPVRAQVMPETYENLWQKTKLAFKYIYDTYRASPICDWVLKIDQDSYVIMENLQSFLVELPDLGLA
jgi:hypothetical protein